MQDENYTNFSVEEIEQALRRRYNKLTWGYYETEAAQGFKTQVNNLTFEVEISGPIYVRFAGEIVAAFEPKAVKQEGSVDVDLSRLIQEKLFEQCTKELEMFVK